MQILDFWYAVHVRRRLTLKPCFPFLSLAPCLSSQPRSDPVVSKHVHDDYIYFLPHEEEVSAGGVSEVHCVGHCCVRRAHDTVMMRAALLLHARTENGDSTSSSRR